jgi:hypothetical protein
VVDPLNTKDRNAIMPSSEHQDQAKPAPEPIQIRKLDKIETTMNVSNPSGN